MPSAAVVGRTPAQSAAEDGRLERTYSAEQDGEDSGIVVATRPREQAHADLLHAGDEAGPGVDPTIAMKR